MTAAARRLVGLRPVHRALVRALPDATDAEFDALADAAEASGPFVGWVQGVEAKLTISEVIDAALATPVGQMILAARQGSESNPEPDDCVAGLSPLTAMQRARGLG